MSSDESDEDFVPGEPEKVSEEDSADEETDLHYEKELEHKNQKRKSFQKSKPSKRCKNNAEMNLVENTTECDTEDPKQDKKHEEDLWAMFLEGTDTIPKPKESSTNETVKPTIKDTVIPKTETNEVKKDSDEEKAKERRIFEFAGETIVVEDNIIKEKIKSTDVPTEATKSDTTSTSSRGRGGGGLSSLLGKINSKNKLSTLEKSKLDWETYKKQEGIEDEVKSDNKSKKGFLDRRDFLERADLRQYEIERDLRMSRRSKR